MIRFQPVYHHALWGGRRFEELFCRSLPRGLVGESWELVELQDMESLSKMPLPERRLGALWRSGQLGGSATGRFPFLLKWLDAEQALSIQVHPNEQVCERLGLGSPKTEAWYVAGTASHARLFLGQKPSLTAESLQENLSQADWLEKLYEVVPQPGEMFLVPAGVVHAVGGGCLLLEVQQPSDTTFRIFDWGRLNAQGHLRPLHLEQAKVAIDYNFVGPPKPAQKGIVGPGFSMCSLAAGSVLPAHILRVLAAALEPVHIIHERGRELLKPGQVGVLEVRDGSVQIEQGLCIGLGEGAILSSYGESVG